MVQIFFSVLFYRLQIALLERKTEKDDFLRDLTNSAMQPEAQAVNQPAFHQQQQAPPQQPPARPPPPQQTQQPYTVRN